MYLLLLNYGPDITEMMKIPGNVWIGNLEEELLFGELFC